MNETPEARALTRPGESGSTFGIYNPCSFCECWVLRDSVSNIFQLHQVLLAAHARLCCIYPYYIALLD